MSEATASTEDSGHHHGTHPTMHYVKIWGLLVFLLFVSVAGPAVGDMMDEGLARTILVLSTAFGVATIKAGIVVHFFMHLSDEKRFVHYILVTSLVLMFVFFAGSAADIMNHAGANWVNYSAEDSVRRGMEYGNPADHHGDHGEASHGEAAEHGEAAGHDEAAKPSSH